MNWEHRKISKLKELNAADVGAFKAAAIDTAGAVVDEFEAATKNSRIATLARKVGVGEPTTATILASVFCDEAEQIASGWASRHWADLAVLAGLTGFAIFLLWIPIHAQLSRSKRQPVVPHVFAARNIPAGSVLQPTDFRVSGNSTRTPEDLAAVLSGGQTTVLIPAGSEIVPGMLSRKKTAGPLLTLPLGHMPVLGSRKLPLDVDLIFSSRLSLPAGSVFKVTLLDASPANQPTTITFRISEKDLVEAGKWIGSADTTVSFLDR